MSSHRSTAAAIELLLASMIWGFGFIASAWALGSFGPITITAVRFLLAALLGLLIAVGFKSLRSQLSALQFWLAAAPGLFLGLTLVLQTWGLKFTTATNSGFITCLYVLFVPLVEVVCFRKRIHRIHTLCVLSALLGVAMICGLHRVGLSQWNKGDVLTLACAIVSAFQIVWLGKIARKIGSAFLFNIYQAFWAGIVPLVFLFKIEKLPQWPATWQSIFGVLFLSIGSSLIAFYAQIRAQKIISPQIAAMIFLLESPFAAVFAFILLGERLDFVQWSGATIILLSTVLALRFSR